MKEQKKNLKILLGILAVLIILFFVAKQMNVQKKENDEKKREAEKVMVYTTDDLQKISYQDVTGKSMEFQKVDDTWTYAVDPEIEMDQSVIQMMEETFSNIRAVREITTPDELEDYGLQSPFYMLTLKDKTGEEVKLSIGSPAGENYYARREDQDTVYTVSPELVGEMVFDLSKVTIKEQFVSVTENNYEKQIVTKPDGTEILYDKNNEALKDQIHTITSGYEGMYFHECVDYHVTEETLHKYGLEEGERTKVVLTYRSGQDNADENELTYYVGGKDDTDMYYYVQLDGSLRVNKVSQEEIDKVLAKVVYEKE